MKKFSLTKFLRARRVYWNVLQELSAYTDRELHDIGIDRADIHQIARLASQEQLIQASNGGAAHGAAIASFPIVDVVDSDDVILAEIAAGLNLDQFDVDLARVGEAMGRAHRQIDRTRSHARASLCHRA